MWARGSSALWALLSVQQLVAVHRQAVQKDDPVVQQKGPLGRPEPWPTPPWITSTAATAPPQLHQEQETLQNRFMGAQQFSIGTPDRTMDYNRQAPK